jgi:hypothetical protein
MVDESVRNKALEEAMREHEENGFHLERQGDFEAVMVKPKKFSFLWAIVWFLFFGIGILVYIFYYLAKSDERIRLEVNQEGRVHTAKI